MSAWTAFWDGLADVCFSVAARNVQALQHRAAHACGRIDRLCNEVGWSVDERDGGTIRLHFTGRNGRIRKVSIGAGDEALVTFACFSVAAIPATQVPRDVMAYLLCRNFGESGFGNWGLHIDEVNNVTFALIYQPLGDGLNASSLKAICESLVGEVADFEGKLRSAGLLR